MALQFVSSDKWQSHFDIRQQVAGVLGQVCFFLKYSFYQNITPFYFSSFALHLFSLSLIITKREELGKPWTKQDFKAAAQALRVQIFMWDPFNQEHHEFAPTPTSPSSPSSSSSSSRVIYILTTGSDYYPCFSDANLSRRAKGFSFRYILSVKDFVATRLAPQLQEEEMYLITSLFHFNYGLIPQ